MGNPLAVASAVLIIGKDMNRYTAIIPYGSNDQYRVVLWVNDTVFNVGYPCKNMDEALELRGRLVDALETLVKTKEKGSL